jgi:hypothetical protein
MERSNRWANLVKKHGSVEAAKAEMRRRAENSARNKGKQGGFHALKRDDPEQFKQITSKGGRNRAQKTRDGDTKPTDSN